MSDVPSINVQVGLILHSWRGKAIIPEERVLVSENQTLYGNISKGIEAKTRELETNAFVVSMRYQI